MERRTYIPGDEWLYYKIYCGAKTIDEIITTLDVHDMKSMGQVIGAVKAKLGNTADGSTVARLVKAALQN